MLRKSYEGQSASFALQKSAAWHARYKVVLPLGQCQLYPELAGGSIPSTTTGIGRSLRREENEYFFDCKSAALPAASIFVGRLPRNFLLQSMTKALNSSLIGRTLCLRLRLLVSLRGFTQRLVVLFDLGYLAFRFDLFGWVEKLRSVLLYFCILSDAILHLMTESRVQFRLRIWLRDDLSISSYRLFFFQALWLLLGFTTHTSSTWFWRMSFASLISEFSAFLQNNFAFNGRESYGLLAFVFGFGMFRASRRIDT